MGKIAESQESIIQEIIKAREESDETILEELSQNINVIKEVITTVSVAKTGQKQFQQKSKVSILVHSVNVFTS